MIPTTLTVKVGLKIIDLKVLNKVYYAIATRSTRVQHGRNKTTLELRQLHSNKISIKRKILYHKHNKLQTLQIDYTRSKTSSIYREKNHFDCKIKK